MGTTNTSRRPAAEIPLHVSRVSRVVDVLVGLLGVLVAAAFFIGVGAFVWGLVNRVAGMVVVAVGLLLCVLAFRSSLRRSGKRPSIVLHEDWLEIDQPEIFDAPPRIARSQIAYAVVEQRSRQVRPWGSEKAFPISQRAGDENGTSHLYDSDVGNPIPLVCSAWDVPNLAILFEEPYRFTQTKPFQGALMAGSRWRLRLQFPNRKDAVMGFMTRVEDPRQTEAALAGWGKSPHAIAPDAAVGAFPEPETYRRRLRRGPIFAGMAFAGALVIRWIAEALSS